MEILIKIALVIHITAGAAALLFGAIAFGLRKNTPKHKPIGRIYFWCMTAVFITAVFLSVAKQLLFLFMIGIMTYYSTIIAYRSLRLKNLHKDQKPLKSDWFIEIIALTSFAGLFTFGIVMLTQGRSGGIIPLVFGSFGLLSVRTNVKLFLKKPEETAYWLKKHVGHMMGSYIGAFTAFLVNQTDKIPMNPIILWFLPSAIIVPVLIWEMKKIRSEPLISELSSDPSQNRS